MKQQIQLAELYQRMFLLTEPKCRTECRCPQSCCSPEYCEMAIEIAREEWGVELERTSHPKLPLMGPAGCTAAPHLRPLCTMHLCSISACGFDKDPAFTKEYFSLRRKIAKKQGG